MEKKRIFKPLNSTSTTNLSDKGKHLPVVKSSVELGLVEAGAKGEGVRPLKTTKTATNPRGSGRKLKQRDKSLYPNHKFIEINPKVFIVLKPESTLEISDFADFIHAAETTDEIVDVLPPLYSLHYKLISSSELRYMIGDKVIVNFKYRSLDDEKNLKEQQPIKIKDIKFKCLNDMSVVIAILEDGGFYPINELEHCNTNEESYVSD